MIEIINELNKIVREEDREFHYEMNKILNHEIYMRMYNITINDLRNELHYEFIDSDEIIGNF